MIVFARSVAAAGWVGWKNENSPVKIVFELDSVRRFHYVSVTCYARKDFGIQVRRCVVLINVSLWPARNYAGGEGKKRASPL